MKQTSLFQSWADVVSLLLTYFFALLFNLYTINIYYNYFKRVEEDAEYDGPLYAMILVLMYSFICGTLYYNSLQIC
jgi:hypothetical protein